MLFDQSLNICEDEILAYDRTLLRLLLLDKTSHRNILWATGGYAGLGAGYDEYDEILPDRITGEHTRLILPRASKKPEMQEERTRSKAEVFTPSWVCNSQNNLIDEQWFGRTHIFNRETEKGWETISEKIVFSDEKRSWKKYVDAQRLEITCGEAPYLVSRYDAVSGKIIPFHDRIGLFDRKMRIVDENAADDEEWTVWSIRALQSVFGYEYQGDNLLLARENLLFSYVDYYQNRFRQIPGRKLLRKAANIIAWNLWQMDGMKFVIPGSCHEEDENQIEECRRKLIFKDHMELINEDVGSLALLPVEGDAVEHGIGDYKQSRRLELCAKAVNVKDHHTLIEVNIAAVTENVKRSGRVKLQRQCDLSCFGFRLLQQLFAERGERRNLAGLFSFTIDSSGAAVDDGLVLRTDAGRIDLLHKGQNELRLFD